MSTNWKIVVICSKPMKSMSHVAQKEDFCLGKNQHVFQKGNGKWDPSPLYLQFFFTTSATLTLIGNPSLPSPLPPAFLLGGDRRHHQIRKTTPLDPCAHSPRMANIIVSSCRINVELINLNRMLRPEEFCFASSFRKVLLCPVCGVCYRPATLFNQEEINIISTSLVRTITLSHAKMTDGGTDSSSKTRSPSASLAFLFC